MDTMHSQSPSVVVAAACKLKQTASNDTAETILEADDVLFDGDDCDDDDDNNNNNQPECPVCMECFVENEIVSWSPSLHGCDHVFHHECIKEWLLHKDTCPYCRVIFLPVDNVHRKSNARTTTISRMISFTLATILPATTSQSSYSWTQEELLTLAEQRSHRLKSTYYCIQDGLVTVPSSPPSSSSNSTSNNNKTIKRMISAGGVQPSDLKSLRGSRASKVNTRRSARMSNNDDDDACDDLSDTASSMIEDSNNNMNRSFHHCQRHSNNNPHSSVSPQILDYSCSVEGDIESCLQHQFQTNSNYEN
jgi:hypothetical protein